MERESSERKVRMIAIEEMRNVNGEANIVVGNEFAQL